MRRHRIRSVKYWQKSSKVILGGEEEEEEGEQGEEDEEEDEDSRTCQKD